MSQHKEELKARLLQKLSAEIDDLVEKYDEETQPTLSDIETMALRLGAKLSQHTTQTLVESHEKTGMVG